MKKILISALFLTFVCGIALAEGGAATKGHDCPFAKSEKEKSVKGHDCPAAAAAQAEKSGGKKPDCPMMAAAKAAKAKKCGGMCPEKLKGVEKTVKNTETGVEITFTAKDKETIAKVQEMMAAKASGEKNCDCKVEGSQTEVANTETGVVVQTTGATPEMIKKIQEASAKEHKCGEGAAQGKKGVKKAAAAGKYICPMKCAGSDKPGKCPKCGMDLVEKK